MRWITYPPLWIFLYFVLRSYLYATLHQFAICPMQIDFYCKHTLPFCIFIIIISNSDETSSSLLLIPWLLYLYVACNGYLFHCWCTAYVTKSLFFTGVTVVLCIIIMLASLYFFYSQLWFLLTYQLCLNPPQGYLDFEITTFEVVTKKNDIYA